MKGAHPDIGPELRQLAQVILDRLDPAVRAAAAAAAGGDAPGKCQQVWCPVCALAALATGEQHPMLTLIAEHSVALMTVIRAMVENIERSDQPPPEGGGAGPEGGAREAPGRYQQIPVTVEE
ncbi:hypothetical protein [Mycobacterium sp.]|uniref:hypothetical protein n=1 Tax=Mycobacterium sp. TaxID=1785 RepID=UPI002D483530|nr:hypothetical protein [Mycobacterium sp.]HZA12756.1 hypothetical protein [Mycobacterium sp.]